MAERRMFAKSVINSARFLTMPPSSRLLYYDLGMAADDDLRVLVSKGFVSLLNDELVAYITDWSTNNQIRKDRYQPSIYKNLLVKLGDGNQRLTDGLPDGNQRSTQYRLGKDSLGKVSTGEENKAATPPRAKRFTPPTLAEVQAYVLERQSPVDPQGFIDFYESKGWLVGKAPMKDWKAACRNAEKWERWNRNDSRSKVKTTADYGTEDFFNA